VKTCECDLLLVGMPLEEAPICAEFEAVDADDCEDCCKHCRHGELCHLEE